MINKKCSKCLSDLIGSIPYWTSSSRGKIYKGTTYDNKRRVESRSPALMEKRIIEYRDNMKIKEASEIKLVYFNTSKRSHVDYFIPVSLGGVPAIENIQYLEIKSNLQKWSTRGEG